MRWRKPPRTIATAASSSDQSGEAKTTSVVRWSPTSSTSGSWPRADGVEHVALGEDPGPAASGSSTTAAPTLALRTSACDASRKRVPGSDREHHVAHPVTHLHARIAPSVVAACNDCLKPHRITAIGGRANGRADDPSATPADVSRIDAHAPTSHHPPADQPLRGRGRHRRVRVRLGPLARRHRPPRRLLAPPAAARLLRDRRARPSASTSPRCAWTAPPSCCAIRGLTVRDVAHRVGYRQPAQFAKAFRRHHGIAPSDFRPRAAARSRARRRRRRAASARAAGRRPGPPGARGRGRASALRPSPGP